MTKRRWKRKKQKEEDWAAHQSRSEAEAPSWSSQHLLLPRSQGKHIILADTQLNGFCGETFAGSVTVSPDSPNLQPTHQSTQKLLTTSSLLPQGDTFGTDRTQPQFSNVWSIWSFYHTNCLNYGWTQAPVRSINSPTSETCIQSVPRLQ